MGAQPQVLFFSVSALSSAARVLAQTATVVVHFLDAKDTEVAKLGVASGICHFAQAQIWTQLDSGETVFDHVRAWVRYEIFERIQAGESTVLIARVVQSRIELDVQMGEPSSALVYHNRAWLQLSGHSPG